MKSVQGTVLRSHAGGYLVYQGQQGLVYFCAARRRLKKEGISIWTGDRVELDEIDSELKTAVIAARHERNNVLNRPPVANVDQVIIVQAMHQPEWSPLLCDTYIVHFQLELPSRLPVLCFNKCDLASLEQITALRSIYEPLGYSVTFVSAKTGMGIDDLVAKMSGKTSVMAGPSGVGKSSLLNYLIPDLKLKIGKMENDTGTGRHTTTASELYDLGAIEKYFGLTETHSSWVVDTPGFSPYDLRHPDTPAEVVWQFPDILALAHDCKYINCLHLVEQGCNVLKELPKISPERFASYSAIVADAQAEYKARKDTSQKVESSVKTTGGGAKAKQIPKLNSKYRNISRRREKQKKIDVDADDEDLVEAKE